MCVGVERRQGRGRQEGKTVMYFLCMLIVQLRSRSFFQRHNVGGSTHYNFYLKYGTYMILRSVKINLRALNMMVPSELTRGGQYWGVISIFRVLELGSLYQP
jgi:hypothetical protein